MSSVAGVKTKKTHQSIPEATLETKESHSGEDNGYWSQEAA